MKKLLLFSTLLTFLLSTASCSDSSEEKESGTATPNEIKGLVEKGPFVEGSSVSIYELDNDMKSTGRVFKTTTDKNGAFSLKTSEPLVSKYVKVAVDGFYFNEYTGEESTSRIILEAITSIETQDVANVNVNVLTHMEMPRVMKLVESGVKFSEAKKQAQEEVLDAFLIKDKTVIPEAASITANNESANILIAISSILLNEKNDAGFSRFMATLSNELATEGKVSEKLKSEISESSLGLSYTKIKENIQNYYKDNLDKDVEVGDFQLFIDGDGDGVIGEDYDDMPKNQVTEENIWSNESQVKAAFNSLFAETYHSLQFSHLLEGVYVNTVTEDEAGRFGLMELYSHQITPSSSWVNDVWRNSYQIVQRCNILIEKANEMGAQYEWLNSYKSLTQALRAYHYLNLVQLWGDVPLVISTDLNEILSLSRTPKDQVLDFIIQEIEEAYPNISEDFETLENFKYFAKTVQAKAYLLRGENNKALDCLNLIVNSGRFALSADYDAIFNGGSKEVIFEAYRNPNDDAFYTYSQLIEKGNGKSIVISRYAETLLLASEANLNNGNRAEAAKYLNQVRARNDQPALNSSDSLDVAILNEYKADLYNEGVYFSALKRFEKTEETLNIPTYKLLMPIPLSELQSNPNMAQNPGYN